ncbi:MAG TPA: ATP-binding protein, partial [Gemmatimonadaceae bacterium]|nr:ATP-binding protein [Gemmatimonadaceae bacterium]
LAAQLSRFEVLFDAVPLAVAVFDETLTLARANARYRELTLVDASPARPIPIYDAFPNALADLGEQIDAVVRGETCALLRVPFQTRGGPRVVEVQFGAIAEEVGARGVIFVGNDVTEREELRAGLARSVAELESIFDVNPDSVRVFDADGRIVRSNVRAQQDHGGAVAPVTLQELWRGDRPRALSGDPLFVHEHPTARALRGESVRGEALEVRRGADGGSRFVEVSANPLRDAAGRIIGAVAVERDVTERTTLARELEQQARRVAALYERVSTEAERLERMVEERTRELMALQDARARERRLTAVGQLAAGVMHDVNNALNPIMAASYLLQAHAEKPEAVRDYAARIARAAETGAATAARVGRFIRQEPLSGERDEEVNLSTMVDEVVAMTRPLWAERARGGRVVLERTLDPHAIVSGVAGEIREALLNLVQNALDAMTGGGILGMVTRTDGEQAVIEVRDSGVGMSPEVRERAFEPFFSTKGGGGTGLGLSEVYGIMKRHRGEAEIDSVEGKGTTVRLVFPRAARGSVAEAPPGPQWQRVPRRVLVVEDNDDGRDFMCAVLASDGHTVRATASVAEARRCLATETFDVLVTDIGLPDGSGWDLVEEARTRHPGLLVGVVTGWEVREADAAAAHFTLRKPVRTHELLARVAGAVP